MSISKFSARKKLDTKQLAEFRRYVSQLKKQGLIPGKTDARVARPSFVRGGKTLAEIVNKNRSKLTPPTKTVGTKPVKKSSSKSTPKSSVKLNPLNRPLSIRNFPTKSKSLAGTLKELDTNFESINRLKKPDEKFAFEIDGIHSYAIFYDIRDLAEYLSESAGIQQVLQKRQKSQELFNALKIVRWNKTATEWKPAKQKAKRVVSHATKQAAHRKRKKS